MALPQPSLRLGGGAPWATKAGNLLAHQYNEALGVYKPIPIGATRNSGGWRVNKQGLWEKQPDNYPRIMFDENANGELLVEPQRTNLLTYSEEFDNAAWLKSSLTVNSNQGIAPDGASNSDLIIPDSILGSRLIVRSATTGQSISSVFLKMKELRYVNFGNAVGVTTVDLQNGTISANNVSVNQFTIEDYGNGWYRVNCYNTSATNYQIQVFFGVDATGANIATNGTDGAYIWSAQLEQGSYATSCIPTVASTVTRNQDVISLTGASALLGNSEGGLLVEGSFSPEVGQLALSDGTAANRVYLSFNAATNVLSAIVVVNGSAQCTLQHTISANQTYKILVKYKENDFELWVDGIKRDNDTLGVTFAANTLTDLRFDAGNGSGPFYGRIRQLVVFDQGLTDAQLEELTTNGLPALP